MTPPPSPAMRRTVEAQGLPVPLCPVDRLPRRRRNQVCIGIIAFGLLNLIAYTLVYAAVGGDAHNGYRDVQAGTAGERTVVYYVRGHHLRNVAGQAQVVSRPMWIYSYLHSITIPLTSGAMIISMLILSRPHILATMRDGWMSGETFVTAFGTIIILLSISVAFFFTWEFVNQLQR
jgi:hypothetical protein